MSRDTERLQRDYTISLLLAGRQWRRAADVVADAYGLSDATAIPLIMIGRLGARRQNSLADAIGVDGPSLVRLLDQLCAAGLVIRREDPTDRRAKVLSLTPEGERTVAKMEIDLQSLRTKMLSEANDADLEASLRVFGRLQRRGPADAISLIAEIRQSR